LTEKVDDQHHGTKKAWLDWFGFVNSKLILQPLVCSTTIELLFYVCWSMFIYE